MAVIDSNRRSVESCVADKEDDRTSLRDERCSGDVVCKFDPDLKQTQLTRNSKLSDANSLEESQLHGVPKSEGSVLRAAQTLAKSGLYAAPTSFLRAAPTLLPEQHGVTSDNLKKITTEDQSIEREPQIYTLKVSPKITDCCSKDNSFLDSKPDCIETAGCTAHVERQQSRDAESLVVSREKGGNVGSPLVGDARRYWTIIRQHVIE